jgi:hypothetical protein
MLRARTASDVELGSWEKFTLHTDDKGWTVTLRAEANGLYVTTEVNYTDNYEGLLRARGTTVGDWVKFHLKRQSNGNYALKSKANGKYVTAEIYDPGTDQGLLRARGTSVGSWERFEIVDLGGSGASARPAPQLPVAAQDFRVMSWNACANHNSKCLNHRVTGGHVPCGGVGDQHGKMQVGHTIRRSAKPTTLSGRSRRVLPVCGF